MRKVDWCCLSYYPNFLSVCNLTNWTHAFTLYEKKTPTTTTTTTDIAVHRLTSLNNHWNDCYTNCTLYASLTTNSWLDSDDDFHLVCQNIITTHDIIPFMTTLTQTIRLHNHTKWLLLLPNFWHHSCLGIIHQPTRRSIRINLLEGCTDKVQ